MASKTITPVRLRDVDPTELDIIERACAAMPPTSAVAEAVRDVLQGIEWGVSRFAGPDARVVVTVERADQ